MKNLILQLGLIHGSISQDMLRDFNLSEVQGIMDCTRAIRYIFLQFDTDVYGAEDFTSDDNFAQWTSMQLKGGGGTDFDVVFNYMEQYNIPIDCN